MSGALAWIPEKGQPALAGAQSWRTNRGRGSPRGRCASRKIVVLLASYELRRTEKQSGSWFGPGKDTIGGLGDIAISVNFDASTATPDRVSPAGRFWYVFPVPT